VELTPPEVGEQSQSVTVDVVDLGADNGLERISTRFNAVAQLKVGGIWPGVGCYLEIVNVEKDQLDGLQYRVFNVEQDLVLEFFCRDFETVRTRMPL
jgi:hypothetical protein